MKTLKLALVGATGIVGRQVLAALDESEFPAEQLTLLASERSEGDEIDYGDETLPVEKASGDALRGMQGVILAVPQPVARSLGTAAQQHGAWVIDPTGAFESDPKVPLWSPGLANEPSRVVCLAPGWVEAALVSLRAVHAKWPVEHAHVTVMLAASHAGQPGIRSFEKQTAQLLNGRDAEPEPFPQRLGFNLVPQVGPFDGSSCAAELLLNRCAARWGFGQTISSTAIWAPLFHGAMVVVNAQLSQSPPEGAVAQALKAAPEVKLLDDPAQGIFPMPMLVAHDHNLHVGRVRASSRTVQWVACVDTAGRVARSAVRLAELLGGGWA